MKLYKSIGGKKMRKMHIGKKLISALLATAMVVSIPLPLLAEQENTPEPFTTGSPWATEWIKGDPMTQKEEYQIYPIPQNISYHSKDIFTISNQVNITVGPNVDLETETYLIETLKAYNREAVKDGADGNFKITLGIKGSGDPADLWFADKNLDDALFQQSGAYALYAQNGEIVILGKDSEAVFYGISTLKMMFSSFAGEKFYPVQIQDYASIDARGYIEGFYGGWTHEQRKSLMKFAPDVKMNLYVYASKTDEYHTNKWNELYPQEQISQFKELAELQKQTKTEFSWSVHLTSMLAGITEPNEEYQQRKEQLMKKFDQLYDIGVRRFCILNDDFGSGSNEMVVKLLNDLTEEYIHPKNCKPIIYCPKGYNNAWANEEELKAMQGFHPEILIFWTGTDVNSAFEQSAINFVQEKTGHNPVFWVNYPCNEHAKSGIFLGSSTHYIRDNITGLAGAVSNPIFFAEADKVALFQLGSYFWNVNNYSSHTEEVWEQCFKYLQPEVYDSYLTIARNVSDCPGSGRIPQGFEESLYLKDTLEQVQTSIKNDTFNANSDAVRNLKAELKHIQSAINDFMTNCTNPALVQELSNPGGTENGQGWVQALDNVAKAGEAILLAKVELAKETPDRAIVWKYFSQASNEMQQYNNRTYEFPGSGKISVKAGSRRLVPFVNTCIEDVKGFFDGWISGNGSEKPADRVYTNMSAYAQTPLTINEKVFSLRDLENITFKKGDYIGIKKKEIAEISSFVLEGENTQNLTLEYSLYGDTWTQIKAGEVAEHLEAKYVRVINKGEKDCKVQLKNLSIVVENLSTQLTLKETNISELKEGSWDMMFDGNKETYIWTNKGQQVGDYITIDLGTTQPIHDITFWTADANPRIYNAAVSISTDNKTFKEIQQFQDNGTIVPPYRNYAADAKGEQGRYIRLEMKGNTGYFLKIHEIEVNKNNQQTPTISPENAITNTQGKISALTDANLATIFQIQKAAANGYLEYRFTDNINVEGFTVLQGTPCNADVIAIKADGSEQKLGTLSEQTQEFANLNVPLHAIRFQFKEGQDVSINELVIRYGKNPSSDVGVAVENIYPDSITPNEDTTINLAAKQPIEVSSVEESTEYLGQLAVDGDPSTRWSSGPLNEKSPGEVADQWFVLDLGENPVLIQNIQVDFFKKVWPMEYSIEVSNDKKQWTTVHTVQRPAADKVGVSDKTEFETPIMARYLRLYFPKQKLNTFAIGGGVSITELAVNGIRKTTEMDYVNIATSLKPIQTSNTTTAKELVLPNILQVTLKSSQKEISAQVLPVWNTEGFDSAQNTEISLYGILPTSKLLINSQNIKAVQKVIKGNPDISEVKDNVQKILEQGNHILNEAAQDKHLYDNDTIQILQVAKVKAQEILDKPESTQEELLQVKNELDQAIQQIKKLELNLLYEVLNQAKLAEKDKYTAETFAPLESAIKEANQLLGQPLSQKQADEMTKRLQTLYGKLELKPESTPNPKPTPSPVPESKPDSGSQIIPDTTPQPKPEPTPNSSSNGQSTTEIIPQTGDVGLPILFGTILLFSILAAGSFIMLHKKRKQ